MNLEDINTSKFLVDPKSDHFVDKMKKLSDVFDLDMSDFSIRKGLTYITLMYDKNSYFRKEIRDFMNRKFEAGMAAGFKLQENKMFPRKVEECMIGVHPSFNQAIIQYAAMQYDMKFIKLISYELNFYKLARDSFMEYDDIGKIKKTMDELSNDIERLQVEIFGGKETDDLIRMLYQGTASIRLRLRPEDMVDEFGINKLRYMTPWGNYNLDNANVVNFVGDKIPKTDE